MTNERLAYQPATTASQAPVYSHDNVAARLGGNGLNQSLPAAQPARAASMRQTEMRYQTTADGSTTSNVSIHPSVPPPVSGTSYPVNSGLLTSAMDAVLPAVPVTSTTQQVTTDQHKPQRDSFDLPAPPTPPSSSTVPSSLSGDQLPSPPNMITPPPDADGHFGVLPLPQYLPPPELVTSLAVASDISSQSPQWHNKDGSIVTSSAVDNHSDLSSLIATQQTDEQPLVRDTRSDLLAAIREGMFLYYFCRMHMLFTTLTMSVVVFQASMSDPNMFQCLHLSRNG